MRRLSSLTLLIAALVAGLPLSGQALQDPDSVATEPDSTTRATDIVPPGEIIEGNPFSGFETHFLSNGVKVWYRHLPGAPNVSVSVGIPYGSDRDPRGREQVAHFMEHMLFSDHRGMTEQQIKEQIEGRGGRRNAFTSSDQTWYYVTIAQEHGLFALEWLGRLMEPHAMDPNVVDRNREPVANEINARPRQPAEQLLALLDPEWLRIPGFWEREFGLETRQQRSYDSWQSLQSISSQDLQEFYETYYAPRNMTVTVVGDLERDEMLEVAQRSFGALLPRTPEIEPRTVEDPGRRRVTHAWTLRSNVNYVRRFKLYEPSSEELLHALFVSDYLGRRLNERLRFGERKAVYGISVGLQVRGPAAYIVVNGSIDREDYEFATGIIDEELDALRSGMADRDQFEADRVALVERLKGQTSTAEALNLWSYRYFYQPAVFRDFPDLVGFYETRTPDALAQFANASLLPDREVLDVTHVLPVDLTILLALAIILVWGTFRLTAWVLTKPIDMKQVRYLARFRTPFFLGVGRFVVYAAVAVVGLRLLIFGYSWITVRWVLPLNTFWVQSSAYAAMVLSGFVLLLVYMSRIPRKLLIFPDHIRVKALSFRSRVLVPEDVAEVALLRGPSVYLGKGLLTTSILTFGFLKPGIHLKTHKGRSLFFRTRKTDEMMAMLLEWWGGKGAQPAATDPGPKPPPDDGPPDDPPPPDDDLDIDSLDIDDPELEALLRSNP